MNLSTDLLIVEDLLLLMMDDKSGVPAGAGTLHYTLGGAVLVELALLGRVETDSARPGVNGPKVLAVGTGPLPDPLLQTAYDTIAQRPRRVQPLLLELSRGLREVLIDRLVSRGAVRHEKKRILGLIPMKTTPAEDTRHEADLRRQVCAVLEDGATPDARTAALIAMLSSSGVLPSLHPMPKWSTTVYKRGKELENGNWGAQAVSTAVTRTAVALATATVAVSVSTITTTT